MKLIFAVIHDKDSNDAMEIMAKQHIGVTRLASTGGFLRDGNTTLMIGVQSEQVDEVLQLLKSSCARRSEMEIVPTHPTGGMPMWNLGGTPIKVEVGGAIAFVVDVDQFIKI